eukprot:CAMPEP_0172312256 /NCGR_PEP_ID=MMETSP1058-20130122/17089_1 /TAXON_ID=83371 /ORGANISM="Detonula confervacea, Strain CCMP 353" /LENGTH=524 /DNA_ID=CAMNT_0013025663 /DNA_START=88 /DNA_END=1659 /DNA_ORIENTATION=-
MFPSPRGILPRRNLILCMLVSLSCSSLHTAVSAFSSCSSNKCLQRSSCSPRSIATICSTKSSDDDGSDSTPPTTFTASQITIDPIIPAASKQTDSATKVNSATLQFNNRLNRMTKSFDAKTAPKVEALLLEAVKNYTRSEEGGQTRNKHIITPNTVSYTNAITAWARCTRKDSAKRAQALLDQMHSLYKEKGWVHVKPNKISYNSVITAWARSRERGSALQAEQLLRNMYDFYNKEGGGEELKPDSRSWNAVINAVARSRDKNCAHRAKFLLDEMGRLYDEGAGDLLPDALTFGAIINAYANSFEEGSSDKASQLLLHMESLAGLGFEKAKPTTFVYNACMNAFAKDPLISSKNVTDGGDGTSSRAAQAEQLLISMEKRYEEEKDHRVMPDCISYSTVINAYANSKTPQSGVHADAILRRMTNRYLLGDTKCRPNAFAFTAAIKAHSAAINAIAEDELTSQTTVQSKQQMEASAGRCEDLLQQLCLLYQNHGSDRSLKPTSVTFEITTKALAQVEDGEGLERVK